MKRKLAYFSHTNAAMDQMVEQSFCYQKVYGSIPNPAVNIMKCLEQDTETHNCS